MGIKIRQLFFVVNTILYFFSAFVLPTKKFFSIDKTITLSILNILFIGIVWTAYGIVIFNNEYAISEGLSFVSVIYVIYLYHSFCNFKINKNHIFCIYQLPLLILFTFVSSLWLTAIIFGFETFNNANETLILGGNNSLGRFYFQNTVLLLLSVFIFTVEARNMHTIKYYLYILVYITSMLAIGSRGIAIGCSLLLILSFLSREIETLFSKKLLKSIVFISVPLVLVLALSPFLNETLAGTRFFDISNSSLSESDNVRFEQLNYILQDFQTHPVLGSGLGHFINGYVRSVSYPYAYELFFMSLLMKIGIVGSLLFFASLVLIFLPVFVRKYKYNTFIKLSYIITLLSIIFMVSTNPVLITPVGFLMLFSPWLYLKLRLNSADDITCI
jgi:O-Antigen ligase